ncbi:UPF0547 protein C16orf87 homolog [Dreissena polymorpha]|uniref:Uncharacterized protein n=1 Tax=Dreissena polymorpha TaxID=45954 RepID=A0A9D4ELZ0_DREPO|nr:UPF0547 protein C16orf87 homolog [Dreissena polymorpha]KAH3781708.1 hypothetical protein DPMN_159611 [Dreissena polymorpha]
MNRNVNKQSKNRQEPHKVVKKCSECEKEIPVACKTCPMCKATVVSNRTHKLSKSSDTEEKDSESKIRRTERIRRERPDFFNALEVENKFKTRRKRKESTEAGRLTSQTSVSSTGDGEGMEEGETPKKRRGRPRSVAMSDMFDKMSESKSPPVEEEDWYGHLPQEKLWQYQIILAEINRKISTQTFNPM